MNYKNKIKNNVILTLCITIIILSIGFILLVLKIENTNKSPKFNVIFSSIKSNVVVKGGLIEPDTKSYINNNNKTISLIFNLNSYKDEINYTVKIKNTGNLKARIFIYEENDYYKSLNLPILVSHNNLNNKILDPNEEVILNLKCTVLKDIENIPNNISYKLTILSESYNE